MAERRRFGSLVGNQIGSVGVTFMNSVKDCQERLRWLYAKRLREVGFAEHWRSDGAIEHAKRELAEAIEREKAA